MTTSGVQSGATGARRPWQLLADREFRIVWLLGALFGVVRWLELLTFGVFVFDVTQSPLIVAVVSLLRMLPLALLGAITGALTERFGPRRTLVWSLVAILLVAAVMAVLAFLDLVTPWHLALAALAGGIFWTTDLPARRTLMAAMAGPENVAGAMVVDAATSNITRAVGPALGGLALATLGLKGALLIGVISYAWALLLLLRLPGTESSGGGGPVPRIWRGILEGMSYALHNRQLAGTLAITVIFNVWGFPFTSMVPVVGRDVLGLGPFPVGLIGSAEGTGAFLGALIMAIWNRPENFQRAYFIGCLLCIVMVLAFAYAELPLLAGAAVLLAGIGAGLFSSMQSTLVLHMAPPALRSRLMGVLVVMIGTAPLGFAHIGLLADWFGPQGALAIMAVEGLAALGLAWWYWPEIRGGRPLQPPT